MSDQLRIDYRPRPDVSPEQEAEILASVYRILLERLAQKESDDKITSFGNEEDA